MGTGRGRVKVLVRDEDALILIDAATTQTRALKKFVTAFMKQEAAMVRPSFQPFEVRIWTSVMPDKRGFHDVDNVAKAVLDSFTGYFWRDDRQVMRLISERFTGDRNRIAVRVRPLAESPAEVEMDAGLFDL